MKKRTLYIIRAVLLLLIIANMTMIFDFSEQPAEESSKTSQSVTQQIAGIVVPEFQQKPAEEQKEIVSKLHIPVRSLAHMAEFGSLAALIVLFLCTWEGFLSLRYLGALAFTFVYALADEWHQNSSLNRAPQWKDIALDMQGAIALGTLALLLVIAIRLWKARKAPRFTVTHYSVCHPTLNLTVAIASDLHGNRHPTLTDTLRAEHPDMILIPGDLTDDVGLNQPNDLSYDFLRAAAEIAPTYYSLGNHEIACYHKGNPWRHPIPVPLSKEIRARIASTGAILLDNECITENGITVCGLTSGICGKENRPSAEVLASFASQSGFRILLCHHPEYFVPYIKPTDIELTVCGHAHGGHWRFFGKGTYAPGQGIFPKYTAGVMENRCVISRGLGNHTRIPRISNKPELIILKIGT